MNVFNFYHIMYAYLGTYIEQKLAGTATLYYIMIKVVIYWAQFSNGNSMATVTISIQLWATIVNMKQIYRDNIINARNTLT